MRCQRGSELVVPARELAKRIKPAGGRVGENRVPELTAAAIGVGERGTVASFRSSVAAEAGWAGAPHDGQKRAPSGSSVPHRAQVGTGGL